MITTRTIKFAASGAAIGAVALATEGVVNYWPLSIMFGAIVGSAVERATQPESNSKGTVFAPWM